MLSLISYVNAMLQKRSYYATNWGGRAAKEDHNNGITYLAQNRLVNDFSTS